MSIDKIKHRDYHYTGIYRGTVVDNVDPDVKGKLKIFVHGVYPEEYENKPLLLPWAEPAMGLFGGNWKSLNADVYGNHLNSLVGWCTVPHKGNNIGEGAEVYVFFEHGDINHPIYFAAVQAGDGWFSEHDNQHVFRSDNVTIRIDLNTTDPKSTTKFNPYILRNHLVAQKFFEANKPKQNMPTLNIPTRMDIQIAARKMVAINLQISGDVNIKHIGDTYYLQQGDRYLTLIGNRYVHHVGATWILQEGGHEYIQSGKNQTSISGNCIHTVHGDVEHTTTGELKNIFLGVCKITFNNDFDLTFDHNFNLKVSLNMTTNIIGDYKLNIGKTFTTCVSKNYNIDVGTNDKPNTGTLEITTVNNTNITSLKGNILITTLGQFELLNSLNVITAEGYKNIGTKGNIRLISNMGNIGIETVGNKDFEKRDVVIPWNPVFLGNLVEMCLIFKDWSVNDILFTRKDFDFKNVQEVSNFILTLPQSVIYDGLPAILPVKMITQNPNIAPVKELKWKDNIATLSPGEYRNFSSVDDNWRNVSNTAYWKVLGRLVGNIDIRSWSGDINVITEGRLGNAGNINISAKDSVGTLPEYTAGNINITNKAKLRIYNDPRHLFFDSISWNNRNVILTNGNSSLPGNIMGTEVLNKKGTAGGCASCISEYLLYLMGTVGPLQKGYVQMMSYNVPLHKHNPLTKIPNDSWETDLIQTGYDHAYDKGMIDDFNTKNHGTITIDSDSSLHMSALKDYKLEANNAYGADCYSLVIKTTPNWQYGELNYYTKTYFPLKRWGVNLGNTLTLTLTYGNKYNYSFTHRRLDQLIYGSITNGRYTNTLNVSDDKDKINFTFNAGKYNNTINENSNLLWVYASPIITYFDPNFVISDPLGIPIIDMDVAMPNILDLIDLKLKNLKKTLNLAGATEDVADKILGSAKEAIDKAVDGFKNNVTSLNQNLVSNIINGAVSDVLTNASDAISSIADSAVATVNSLASNAVGIVSEAVTGIFNSIFSLLLGTPLKYPGVIPYIEVHNKNELYYASGACLTENFTQTHEKSGMGIATQNYIYTITNRWNQYLLQEYLYNGVPAGHFVLKTEGIYGLTNFAEFQNGMNIIDTKDAVNIGETEHAVSIEQFYNTAAYNKVNTAAENTLSYIGPREINDGIVEWTVMQLNFIQG